VATWEGVDLDISADGASSGAAFQLDRPSKVNARVRLAGATACMTYEKRIIVVTLENKTTEISAIHSSAHDVTQRALDLIGAEYSRFYSTPDSHLSYICWWRGDAGETVLHLSDYSQMTIRRELAHPFPAAFDQSVTTSSDANLPRWSEALRYLRYSQIEDDLYDAYRKAYLAVESLLSEYFPHVPTSPDGKFARKSLRELVGGGFDLSPFVKEKSGDLVENFHHEQYTSNRCAQGHAKISKDHKLPARLDDRDEVRDSLVRLGSFVLAALSHLTGVSSKNAVTTSQDGISATQSEMKDMQICLSSREDINPDESDGIQPSEITLIPTVYLGQVGQSFDHAWIGKQAVDQLPLSHMSSFGGVISQDSNEILEYYSIPRLRLEGIDLLQVRLVHLWSENGGVRYAWSL
jgi:hypothetical protein